MEPAPHIALVDDHRDIRDLVSRYLSQHGYRVSVAENGAALRRLLERSAPDLVVLDIMMPGEDGISVCRHLRSTTNLPIIFLTAMAEETERIIGLEIGADDYLTKPFNPRELLARIKAVLRRVNSLPPQRDKLKAKAIRFDRWHPQCRATRTGEFGGRRCAFEHRRVPSAQGVSSTTPAWC